jgi:hypothetical protein
MAYVTTEIITKARASMKVLNKEYGMKSALSGKGSSTLRLCILEGCIDFVDNYWDVNQFKDTGHLYQENIRLSANIKTNHFHLHRSFSKESLVYLEKAKAILKDDHWDESDAMIDYFSCSFYIDIEIGKWDKPYKLVDPS